MMFKMDFLMEDVSGQSEFTESIRLIMVSPKAVTAVLGGTECVNAVVLMKGAAGLVVRHHHQLLLSDRTDQPLCKSTDL
jgi:hypothetical protein